MVQEADEQAGHLRRRPLARDEHPAGPLERLAQAVQLGLVEVLVDPVEVEPLLGQQLAERALRVDEQPLVGRRPKPGVLEVGVTDGRLHRLVAAVAEHLREAHHRRGVHVEVSRDLANRPEGNHLGLVEQRPRQQALLAR